MSSLKDIARNVQTNVHFCFEMGEELKQRGYDWFNGFNGMTGEEDEYAIREQVMKVLAVAANEAIQVKVDFNSCPSGDDQTHRFLQLLNIDGSKLLRKYFDFQGEPLDWILLKASSPCDIAKYMKKSAPQWLIENLFQCQFDIRWNTPNGEPANFTFYQFCCQENTIGHLKYLVWPTPKHRYTTSVK